MDGEKEKGAAVGSPDEVGGQEEPRGSQTYCLSIVMRGLKPRVPPNEVDPQAKHGVCHFIGLCTPEGPTQPRPAYQAS